MADLTLPEKVTALNRALTKAGIDHAFGGALALAYYAEPRATIDVDVNVFVPPSDVAAVRRALEPLGVDPRRSPDEAIERDAQGRWWWGSNPVDLFFRKLPLHDAMAEDARTVPFGDGTIPILSPEHLIVCKALFDRVKDWLDIEQVLAATSDLDVEGVQTWLTDLVGGDDPRTVRFAALAAHVHDPGL